MTKSRFLIVILLILIVIIVSIVMLKDEKVNIEDNNQINIVTTFYPLELIVDNLIKGVDNVRNINISASVGGCVHDYEMTPADMKKLETADLIVINGQGMEHFIEKISINENILDTSQNIPNKNISSHIWLDFDNYISQIQMVANSLIELDKDNEQTYKDNMNEYIQKINDIKSNINIQSEEPVVIMHDAFKYYSNMGMFNVECEFLAGHENNYSANDIKSLIERINNNNIKILFVDSETFEHNQELINAIKKETNVDVYILNLCVDVSESLDQYLDVMKDNMKVIEEAVEYVK